MADDYGIEMNSDQLRQEDDFVNQSFESICLNLTIETSRFINSPTKVKELSTQPISEEAVKISDFEGDLTLSLVEENREAVTGAFSLPLINNEKDSGCKLSVHPAVEQHLLDQTIDSNIPLYKTSLSKQSNMGRLYEEQDLFEFQAKLLDLRNKTYEDLRSVQMTLSQDYSSMLEIFEEFWSARSIALQEAIKKADKITEILEKAKQVDASKRDVLIDHLKAKLSASRWIKKRVDLEAAASIKELLKTFIRFDYEEVQNLERFVDSFLLNPDEFKWGSFPRPTCDPFLVMVTRVIDPGEFYVVRWCDKVLYERISRVLQKEALAYPKPSRVVTGKLYAVLSKEAKWYRGLCGRKCFRANTSERSYSFTFVDEGHSEIIPSALVHSLPEDLEDLPAMAMQCTLNHLFERKPFKPEATAFFKQATQNSPMSMKVFSQDGGTLNVDLAQLPSYGEINHVVSLRDGIFLESPHINETVQKPTRKFEPKYDLRKPNRTKVSFLLAKVAWAHNPANIYVNIIDEEWLQFVEMQRDLQNELANPLPDVPNEICIGHTCAVKFLDEWYRALVEQVLSKRLVTVFLVDNGHRLTISKDDCHQLPDSFMALPTQSVRCVLDGLKTTSTIAAKLNPKRRMWDLAANDHLRRSHGKTAVISVSFLTGCMVGKLELQKELTLFSIMYVDGEGTSLNHQLCALNFATSYKETAVHNIEQVRIQLAAENIATPSTSNNVVDGRMSHRKEVEETASSSEGPRGLSNQEENHEASLSMNLSDYQTDVDSLAQESKRDLNLSAASQEVTSLIEISNTQSSREDRHEADVAVPTTQSIEDLCPRENEEDLNLSTASQEINSSPVASRNTGPEEVHTNLKASVPATKRKKKIKSSSLASCDRVGQKGTKTSERKCFERGPNLKAVAVDNCTIYPAGMSRPRSRINGGETGNASVFSKRRRGKPSYPRKSFSSDDDVEDVCEEKEGILDSEVDVAENKEDTPSVIVDFRPIDGERYVSVNFSWCQSPNAIFCRTDEMADKLTELLDLMQKHYRNTKLIRSFEVSGMCAAFCQGLWQRARIIRKEGPSKYRVLLLDEGFERTVDNAFNFRPIEPQFENFPKLVFRVSLFGIYSPTEVWDRKANIFITEKLTEAKEVKFFCRKKGELHDQIFLGILLCTTQQNSGHGVESTHLNLNEELIREGYATAQPSAGSAVTPPKLAAWKEAVYPNVGHHFWAKITWVDNDGSLILQDVKNEDKLAEFFRCLAKQYDNTNPTQADQNAKPGDLCIAKPKDYKKWFRGVVKHVYPHERLANVHCIDYGFALKVRLRDIRVNVKLDNLPTQCLRFKLHNMKPFGGDAWHANSLSEIRKFLVDREFTCTIVTEDGVLLVIMQRKSGFLIDELVKNYLADYAVPSQSKSD